MLFIIAIVCPPFAALLAGKREQAILNLVLTVLGYIPGLIHAFIVIRTAHVDHENMHSDS